MRSDRRQFLQFLTSGAVSAAFSGSLAKAMQIPANRRNKSIRDVEHIVILTQENRSFDSYFGTLRGVRGFSDPRAVKLPNGKKVWYQPNGSSFVLPFRPPVADLGKSFLTDVEHDWNSSHQAWNEGRYDQWIPAKGEHSMVYYTRADIPFHFALADAFTICDAYYCSLLGPTDPNRYHMWTGWVGNDGSGGGPVISNAEAGYDWSTYPEVLQAAGVSWKVYQDVGDGLDAAGFWGWTGENPYIGNYGDNSLLYFHQYQNARPGTPLYQGARTGTNILSAGTLFDELRNDVKNNTLPEVSWIAAPEAYTEHPNWTADYGAWYIGQVLDALTSNPAVWSKTALFLNYDENGGFFDHMVPPTPPASRAQGLSTVDTVNEIFPGANSNVSGPYGLGVRVPMIVVSPWSKGGWVNSEVFDHTSLIQFIEARFGTEYPNLRSPNITPWRRAVTGDLTSAFDFRGRESITISLPDTTAYQPPAADVASAKRYPDYNAVPPADQSMPSQESGLRPARPVPYELHVRSLADSAAGTLTIHFSNRGTSAAVFQVRAQPDNQNIRTYTVGPNADLSDTWNFSGLESDYNLSVYGPNGFFREFEGSLVNTARANLEVTAHYDTHLLRIGLHLRNGGSESAPVRIRNKYTGEVNTQVLSRGASLLEWIPVQDSFGWYDLVVTVDSDTGFRTRTAGHIETGRDSMSDPKLGAISIEPEKR